MSNKTGNNQSDRHLVEKVLGGDTDAFGMIIRNTEGLVAQIVFKMISNAEDRKDLAQEVYLKAFQGLPRFKFNAKLSTWIAQITYNSCSSYLVKKKLVLPGYGPGGEEWDEEPGYDTEMLVVQKELSSILSAAIEELSPVFKTLITLYHNEELSYEEIGQITGLPQGTIKSYLFRARKALKDRLLLKYKKEGL